MTDLLYDSMAIPDACHLGKRVFKKLFHENAKLGATDKKAFREDIDTITWEYTLKPSTIQIQSYEDDQREYHEVAVLHVNLKTQKRTARIAEIMHRAIPYPLLIVFEFKELEVRREELEYRGKDPAGETLTPNSSILHSQIVISTAHKRFSQAEKGAVVAEDFMITEWIDLSNPTSVQRDFMASLAVADLPHTHFSAFYGAIVDRLVALDCARLTGEYLLESAAGKRRARRDRLAACHDLEGRIEEFRAAIKKETQFNRQVELNTKMKNLEKELEIRIEELGGGS